MSEPPAPVEWLATVPRWRFDSDVARPGSVDDEWVRLVDVVAAATDDGRYPTVYAYEQACAALKQQRERAEAAEAERDAARAQVEQLCEDVRAVNVANVALEAERDEAHALRNDVIAELAKVEAERDRLKAQLLGVAWLEGNVVTYCTKQEYQELRAERDLLKAENISLHDYRELARGGWKQQELEAELTKSKAQVTKLEVDLTALRAAVAKLGLDAAGKPQMDLAWIGQREAVLAVVEAACALCGEKP
jgi:hypothetical protein